MKKSFFEREPRWQQEQKEKRRKKNLFFVCVWLVIVFLLLFGGLVIRAWGVVKKSVWNGQGRINFVLKGEETVLVSFEPNQKSLVLISIPQQTLLEVPYGYGKYRVEAIKNLETLEKKEFLLSEGIQESLAVPIDGWVKTVSFRNETKNEKEKLIKVIEEILIKKQGETNFSFWDILRLWWKIKKVRPREIEILDLGKINVLLSVKLPDGTTVFEIDFLRLDPLIQKYFSDLNLKKERFSVEVLNGTTHSGLAEKGARILSNLGAEVVWVGNSKVKSEKCLVESTREKKKTWTVSRIRKIFGCFWQEKKEEDKAEITLILGEDYWRKLTAK